MTSRFPLHRSVVYGLCVLAAACAPSSLVDVSPPNSVADPSVVATAAGATQLYNFAITRWADAVGGDTFVASVGLTNGRPNFAVTTGAFTDELMKVQGAPFASLTGTDERTAMDGGLGLWLQSVRVASRQAREMLRAYAPNTPTAWQARLAAAEAYGLIYLAEAFCSGIPLSTVPLVTGEPTGTRGFTTQEVLEQAVALFDTAVTLAGDSTRFASLAKVGKGRALLGLGRFADAAPAVADVPTDFVYLLELGSLAGNVNWFGNRPQNFQVHDNEGGNGLIWSTDPRAAIVTTPTISSGMLVPAKYAVSGGVINPLVSAPNTPIRGADGVEARLIEAEAALAANDPAWLAKLNTLRGTCVGTAPCAPLPGLTAAAMPALTDPGTTDARLNLLMRERAMWMYLTGHRQGDLRRLAHVYHRDPATLWPAGLYVNPGAPPLIAAATNSGTLNYGPMYVGTMASESPANPLYTGCTDLNP